MNIFQNIFVVLVNPSHPGNIGGVARAMKNMGLSSLRLVKPQRSVNEESYARSAGADDILDRAEYFEDFASAISDCQLVFGTSARVDVPDVIDLPARQAAELSVDQARAQKVALVFGREHAGLTNEELAFCQYHVYIPSNPQFSSLNLAAAVQVMCYEVFCAASNSKASESPSEALATQQEIALLFEHLQQTLQTLDFYDPENPRRLMPKLRALFNRTQLLKSEVAILRGVLNAVDKK